MRALHNRLQLPHQIVTFSFHRQEELYQNQYNLLIIHDHMVVLCDVFYAKYTLWRKIWASKKNDRKIGFAEMALASSMEKTKA